MDCEICGRNDRLTPIAVQGSQMWVCQNCTSHGVEISQKTISFRPTKRMVVKDKEEEFFEFVENYGKKIQQARQKLGFNHKEFAAKIAESDSLVKKIETEKMRPTEKTIKKIEKLLNIKIYKKVEE